MIILNWTPDGKDPMNSVLSVIPFVSSIFFSKSALRLFVIFCINLGGNMGLNILNKMFQKNLYFLKMREK